MLCTEFRWYIIYISLQDTVIALQALGRYAAATKWSTTELQIDVKDSRADEPIESFVITTEDTNREFVVPLVSSQ